MEFQVVCCCKLRVQNVVKTEKGNSCNIKYEARVKQHTERPQDIQGRIKAAKTLKPGEGESYKAATANILRNKPWDLTS